MGSSRRFQVESGPPNGWVFALRGNLTWDFFVYKPFDPTGWHYCDSVPETVEAGGALCFGGIQVDESETTGTGYLYALSGKEDENGRARFFRYSFDLPGPGTDGTWCSLPPLPAPLDQGAALTWVQLPDDLTAAGNVMALCGGGSRNIYKYDASRDIWEWQAAADEGYEVQGGGAMAGGPGGTTVWCFPGGEEQQNWWLYDIIADTFHYYKGEEDLDRTPQPQNPGTAMAFDGTDTLYAEFGGTEFWRFYPGAGDGDGGEGGQSGNLKTPARLSVAVVPGHQLFRFRIKAEEPSPVTLRLFDPAGRLVDVKRCDVTSSAETELVWDYRDAASGVYYYTAESNSASVRGKLTVVK